MSVKDLGDCVLKLYKIMIILLSRDSKPNSWQGFSLDVSLIASVIASPVLY